ncbi:MAG: tetratricopeptide repeat protein [Polyangiaceae bacterium]|nr:tetratricopeptide repeat protein [Polyangiaceae bacterium]
MTILSFKKHLGSLFVCAALAGAATLSRPAFAQGGGVVAEESKRAIELYTEGRDLLTAGKAAEALPKLIESLRLLPSPNTELLIAHAKRELGRRAEALETYERVLANAQNEVARGQDRYKGTLEEAKRWIGSLGGELGTVVVSAPEGARIDVARGDPQSPATFIGSGRAYAEPGEVRVTMTVGDRTETKTARVGAGTTARVDFSTAAPTGPSGTDKAAPQPKDDGPVVSIAGIALLSGGVVGMAMFAGFGVSAKSTLDGLEECSPHCPDSRREEQDAGKRDQLIANISVGIGAGLLAAGATAWIVEAVMAGGEKELAPAAPAARIDVGVPGAFDAAGLTFTAPY